MDFKAREKVAGFLLHTAKIQEEAPRTRMRELAPEALVEAADLVTEMREQGLTVVMISHNLNHVFDLCDRITVLKTGRLAGSRHISETSKEEVLRMIMTGSSSPDEDGGGAKPVRLRA